jgi:hypothetical protein
MSGLPPIATVSADIPFGNFVPPADLPRPKQITYTSIQIDGGLSNPPDGMNASE